MQLAVGVALKAFGLLCALTLLLVPAGAQASEADGDSTTARLLVSPTPVEIAASGKPASVSVEFWVEGQYPKTLGVEFVDLVIGENGSKSLLPLGATAHSLGSLVTLPDNLPTYFPDGSRQRFVIDITAPPFDLSRVHFGGLEISMSDPASGDNAGPIRNTSSIVVTVVLVPEDWSGVLPESSTPKLEISKLRLRPVGERGIIDRLIPDLPGVINRGPVELVFDVANESETPGYFSTDWVVSNSHEALLVRAAAPRLVIPGDTMDSRLVSTTAVSGSAKEVNVLSGFGLHHAEARVTGSLSSVVFLEDTLETTFFIAPWKETLVAAAGVVLLVALGRRNPRLGNARKPAAAPGEEEAAKSLVTQR